MSVAVTRLEGPGGEVLIGDEHPFAIVGERINPTGRAKLTEEIVAGDMTTVQADAVAQVEAGARVLDLNAGVPGFDEPAMLSAVVKAVHEVVDVPLCIDSSTPEALEAAVPLAQGKVLINSVTAEAHSLERLLPLVKKLGAAVIGMANDEEGISMDPSTRLAAARKVVGAAADHGIARDDVIIDPLTMPIGAAPDAATAMFETVRLIRHELGVNVSCGASNISFGMPERRSIDASFLTMAIHAGMNTAITNPLHPEVRKAVLAADLLLGRDAYGAAWIADHRAQQAAAAGGS
ncbi:MAG TPA: dihydropteroate synthase [Actinomycetota bacterium]|nr:dihydropteroate synthase [Actinomycetota bacterium]